MKSAFVLLAGFGDLIGAAFHAAFWRLFRWPETLAGSGRLNAAVTQVMNIMLIYTFAALGLALLWLREAAPPALLLAAVGFGALRLALQGPFFGYGSRASRGFALALLAITLLHLAAAFV